MNSEKKEEYRKIPLFLFMIIETRHVFTAITRIINGLLMILRRTLVLEDKIRCGCFWHIKINKGVQLNQQMACIIYKESTHLQLHRRGTAEHVLDWRRELIKEVWGMLHRKILKFRTSEITGKLVYSYQSRENVTLHGISGNKVNARTRHVITRSQANGMTGLSCGYAYKNN